jgi:hypothetical protein
MLLCLVAASVFLQQAAPASQEPVSATKLIEKMLAHYSEAKSAAGTITLVQSAGPAQVQINTQFQFEAPSKLYIRQDKPALGNKPGRTAYISSNAKTFTFSKPSVVVGADKLETELVTQHGVQQTYRELYAVFRSTAVDPNAMLEVAIGRNEDLRALLAQWVEFKLKGTTQVNGKEAYVVVGNFREVANQPVSGMFEAYITKEGDFLRYALRQRYAQQDNPANVLEVLSVWNADIKLDGGLDPALFKG